MTVARADSAKPFASTLQQHRGITFAMTDSYAALLLHMTAALVTLQAFAEAVLAPKPFLPETASCLEADKAAALSSPGLQWDLQHLMQSIASARQQEQLTL